MSTKNIILSLGGNLGDTRGYFRNSLSLLEERLGYISQLSYFYQTASWGYQSTDFLNLALVIETKLSAIDCLLATQSVEDDLGRMRYNDQSGYTDRSLDVDIIFYGNEIINTDNLIVPHPKMQDRNFVLEPLAEIIPHFHHPVLNKSILELAKQCQDTSKVIRLNEQV